jgi:predicted SnoaL-like aldol condensation-catalyzing enzyme
MHEHDAKTQANKAVVVRFNEEGIEQGSERAFRELLADDFVNRSAPPGAPAGPDGMIAFFTKVLRPAVSDLTVEIHDQVAEGDLVTTRKTIRGKHTGELFGIPATEKPIAIDVIDIVRVRDGRYAEHWGVNTLASVLGELRGG